MHPHGCKFWRDWWPKEGAILSCSCGLMLVSRLQLYARRNMVILRVLSCSLGCCWISNINNSFCYTFNKLQENKLIRTLTSKKKIKLIRTHLMAMAIKHYSFMFIFLYYAWFFLVYLQNEAQTQIWVLSDWVNSEAFKTFQKYM